MYLFKQIRETIIISCVRNILYYTIWKKLVTILLISVDLNTFSIYLI